MTAKHTSLSRGKTKKTTTRGVCSAHVNVLDENNNSHDAPQQYVDGRPLAEWSGLNNCLR